MRFNRGAECSAFTLLALRCVNIFYSKRVEEVETFCVLRVGATSAAIDSNGRTIWIADAHRDDGKRFIVHADEKLTAFAELELVIQTFK